MTPTETTTILRQFNEWRRGDEDIPQFDPRKLGEAIDAAVEMIDRLEAAEKERDAAELMSLALRAKIAEMDRQEPVAFVDANGDLISKRDLPPWADLYALPGAHPSYLPSDLAEAIIADMQAQYDSELITENDSCEALIRLDGAIAAVEDNFAAATEAKP